MKKELTSQLESDKTVLNNVRCMEEDISDGLSHFREPPDGARRYERLSRSHLGAPFLNRPVLFEKESGWHIPKRQTRESRVPPVTEDMEFRLESGRNTVLRGCMEIRQAGWYHG